MAGIINDVFEGLAVNVTTSVTAGTTVSAGAGLTVITGNADVLAGNVNIGTAIPANPYDLSIEKSVAGLIGISIQNTSANPAAAVNVQHIVEPATADAFSGYFVNGGGNWAVGLDNSDSDGFKITTGTSPSAGIEVFNATTAGAVTLNGGIVNVGSNAADDAINIGTAATAGRTVIIGNTTGTSATNIRSGSGGIGLTGVVTSANAITITSGDMTLTSGNLKLPTTTSAIGQIQINSVRVFHTFGTRNTFIGAGTGNFTLTGTDNLGVGTFSTDAVLSSLTTGFSNIGIGNQTLHDCTTGFNNVAIGGNSLVNLTTGRDDVGVGGQNFTNLTTGNFNTALGSLAGNSHTGADTSNICIGYNALGVVGQSNRLQIGNATGTGDGQLNKVFIHGIRGITSASTDRYPINIDVNGQFDATGNLYLPTTSSTVGQIQINNGRVFHTFGTSNTFVGASTGNFTLTTASENVGIGGAALVALTTGDNNTSVGFNSGVSITSGDSNAVYGTFAGQRITTGRRNNTLGYDAGGFITTGESNVMIGYQVGASITTGSYNVFLGYQAGSSGAANSSNIFINNTSGVSESNTCRIGAATGTGNQQINSTFIHGIRGITTGVADAIAVLVDSAGQLGTVSSSIRYKQNVQDLGSTKILELRPVSFNYKIDNRHAVGLIAEEVERVMPELVARDVQGNPESVKYHDLPVYLLNEIQRLTKRIEVLEAEMRGEF